MAAMGSMTTPRRTGWDCGIANIMPAPPATGDVRKQISERPRPPWAADVKSVTGLAAQSGAADFAPMDNENVTRTAWRGVGRYVKTRSALFRRAKGSMANRRALRVVSGPADARSRDPSWATGLLRGGELEPQVKLKELPDRDRQQHEAPGPQGPGDRR